MLPNIKPAPKQPSSSHPSPIFPHHHKHCQTFFISHASPWHPPPCDVQLRINHFPPFLKLHKLIEMKFIVDQKFIFRWLLLTSFTFGICCKFSHQVVPQYSVSQTMNHYDFRGYVSYVQRQFIIVVVWCLLVGWVALGGYWWISQYFASISCPVHCTRG